MDIVPRKTSLEMIKKPTILSAASLPPAAIALRHDEDTDVLYCIAEAHFKLLVRIINNTAGSALEEDKEYNYTCTTCTDQHHCSKKELLDRSILTIGDYYCYATHLLVTRGLTKHPGIGVPGAGSQDLNWLDETLFETSPYIWAIPLLMKYTTVLQCARVLYLLRRVNFQSDAVMDDFEKDLSHALLDIFKIYESSLDPNGLPRLGTNAQFLMRKVLHYSMHLLNSVFSWPIRPWSQMHTQGPFSALRLPELQLIAERNDRVKQIYGEKNLEKVFERQLALLAQSFGFYVVGTRAGERSVDLLCISADPSSSFTFLLEAKTTSRAYSLPTKDERALLDYINEVRRSLTTSPPLAFVLIVGSKPSKTLVAKLRTLEHKAEIPVRFCTAQQLATLREKIVGPTAIDTLRRCIISADYIATESDFETVVAEVEAKKEAQEALVRAFMPSMSPRVAPDDTDTR